MTLSDDLIEFRSYKRCVRDLGKTGEHHTSLPKECNTHPVLSCRISMARNPDSRVARNIYGSDYAYATNEAQHWLQGGMG